MKRTVSVLLLMTLLLLLLSGCGAEDKKIENYEWKLRTVMHAENGALVMDAVNEKDSAHPEAKVVDVTLTAKDGKITITDHTNGKTYEGTYYVEKEVSDAVDYRVTINGQMGYATVAMTTYADGREEPTLPINLSKYSIYFYAESVQ